MQFTSRWKHSWCNSFSTSVGVEINTMLWHIASNSVLPTKSSQHWEGNCFWIKIRVLYTCLFNCFFEKWLDYICEKKQKHLRESLWILSFDPEWCCNGLWVMSGISIACWSKKCSLLVNMQFGCRCEVEHLRWAMTNQTRRMRGISSRSVCRAFQTMLARQVNPVHGPCASTTWFLSV